MEKTILCNVFALKEKIPHPCLNAPKEANNSSILKIYPNSNDESYELEISEHMTIELNFGDRVECTSGTVFFKFKAESNSRTFILSPKYKYKEDKKYRCELIVDRETTQMITDQNLGVVEDIKKLILNKDSSISH